MRQATGEEIENEILATLFDNPNGPDTSVESEELFEMVKFRLNAKGLKL